MKIIECPRDAMQGIESFIPTKAKVSYINQLLRVGFDTIDFGSFVSAKAIPQMKDTVDVLTQLNLSTSISKLLAIVANVRGAEAAADFDEITYLGYPLSLSETFQRRNTNRSIETAMDDLAEIQEICQLEEKTLVVYLSMGFGNPYGDPYNPDYVDDFVSRLDKLEVGIISIADTIGVSTPDLIKKIFQQIIPKYPHIEFGAHLHSRPTNAREKVEAAVQSGCRRMDGAIRGFGGCPMAEDDLIGNIATEDILETLKMEGVNFTLDEGALQLAINSSMNIFPS